MRNKLAKLTCILTVFVLLVGLLPMTVYASDEVEIGAYTTDPTQGTVKITDQSEGESAVGNFTVSTVMVISAFPKAGYKFKEWEIRNGNGDLLDTNIHVTVQLIVPSENRYYYAKFEEYTPEFINKIEIEYTNAVAFTDGIQGHVAKGSIIYNTPASANYEGETLPYGNVFICECSTTGNPSQIQANNYNLLDPAKYNYICFTIYAKPVLNDRYDGNPPYDFDANNLDKIEVWVNGVKRDDAIVAQHNDFWRSARVYVPITITPKGNTYWVKFEANGGTMGTIYNLYNVNEGDKLLYAYIYNEVKYGIDPPENMELDYIEINGSPLPADGYTVTGDVNIKPIWKAKSSTPAQHTVTFYDGSTELNNVQVNEGEKAVRPTTDPTKAGFTFDNWYADATFATPFDFDNTAITANTSIYAKFVENAAPATSETPAASAPAETPATPETPAATSAAPATPETPATSENSTITYTVVGGGNSSFTAGNASDLVITIKRSEADETCFSHFTGGVQVDGKPLEIGKDYTAVAGSTVITIKAETLNKLSEGVHTITVLFDQGKVETSVTVKASEANSISNKNGNKAIPATGETSTPILFVGIAFVAVAGMLFAAVLVQKKRKSAQR